MDNPKAIQVLIVEDQALVSETIQYALKAAGYQVVGSAADGAAALKMVTAVRPDVVLMDIDLPDIDGLEVTRQLLAETPLPVVVLTAHETAELIARAGAVGVSAYLTKPPKPRELDRAIRLALARFAELQAVRREKAALEAAFQPTLLFVDDDEMARLMYPRVLQRGGYRVIAVGSAEEALNQLEALPATVVVSDIMMPGLSGLDLLAKIQEQRRQCEVILITASGDVQMAVQAMHAGAFHYLVKPVEMEQLLDTVARADEAVRRRWKAPKEKEPTASPLPPPGGPEPPGPKEAPFRLGGVVLDPDRLLITVNGQRVETTPTETQLLLYFCRNPNRVLSAQELVREVRGLTLEAAEAAELIRPHINSLRRKLLAVSPEADVIETVRAAGYRLNPQPGA